MWNVVIIKSTDVDRLVLLLCSSSQFSVGHHHTKTAHAQCNQRLLISSEGCQIVQLQRNNFVSFHCTSTKTSSAPSPVLSPTSQCSLSQCVEPQFYRTLLGKFPSRRR